MNSQVHHWSLYLKFKREQEVCKLIWPGLDVTLPIIVIYIVVYPAK